MNRNNAEVIYHKGPWQGLEDVEHATLAWVDWFNNRRILSSIGDVQLMNMRIIFIDKCSRLLQHDLNKTVSYKLGSIYQYKKISR